MLISCQTDSTVLRVYQDDSCRILKTVLIIVLKAFVQFFHTLGHHGLNEVL